MGLWNIVVVRNLLLPVLAVVTVSVLSEDLLAIQTEKAEWRTRLKEEPFEVTLHIYRSGQCNWWESEAQKRKGDQFVDIQIERYRCSGLSEDRKRLKTKYRDASTSSNVLSIANKVVPRDLPREPLLDWTKCDADSDCISPRQSTCFHAVNKRYKDSYLQLSEFFHPILCRQPAKADDFLLKASCVSGSCYHEWTKKKFK